MKTNEGEFSVMQTVAQSGMLNDMIREDREDEEEEVDEDMN